MFVFNLDLICIYLCFFFLNDTAPTEIYTLSLHDALPIFEVVGDPAGKLAQGLHLVGLAKLVLGLRPLAHLDLQDRKSTRLNSSHANISYAVFCLKKKKIAHVIISITLLTTMHSTSIDYRLCMYDAQSSCLSSTLISYVFIFVFFF